MKDIDLVHVIWGKDQGLVSLKQSRVICYAYGRIDGFYVNEDLADVSHIEISDRDFDTDESNWNDVVSFLKSGQAVGFYVERKSGTY